MLMSWRNLKAVLLVIAALSFQTTQARSNGQNIDAACTNMIPFHQVATQTTPSPFAVVFNTESYTPGTPVTVTIEACTATPFRGFMIQARRATVGSDQNEMLGSFTPVAGTQQSCGGKALVHTSSADKTQLTFLWNPPSTSQGHVQFWITFVQTRSTFWAAVKSDVLKDGSTNFNPASVNPASTVSTDCGGSAPAVSVVAVPSGCGTARGCIYRCPSGSCNQVISWEDNGNSVLYTVTSKVASPTSYIALGFSTDQAMGGDSVTGCAAASDGTIVIFNAENIGRTDPVPFTDNDVTLTRSSITNNILSCTFQRPKAASNDRKRFDVTQKWIIIFATSGATVSGQTVTFNYHNDNKFFTSEKYSSNDRPDINLDPGSPATQPPPVATGDLTVPSGCGSSLGCVSKCEGSKCETIISWQDGSDKATYTISSTVASSTSFAAIGFSSDDKMGGDSVTGCASASDGTIVLFNGENTGKSPPSMFDDSGVVLKSSSFKDNVISCTFERPKSASADGKRFDVSEKWFILFAKGSATVNGQDVSVSYHSENKFVTGSKFSSSDTPNDQAEDLEYPLIKAHGSLMVAAWIFLASIGIVAARYYKPVWTQDLCSQKVWFQIHRTCMVLVFCTTVAGFVVIFLEVEDWSDLIEDDEYLEYHPIMGVIVTALTVLNPLMALIRPHPGTKNRPIFNWAHWFVGTAAHVLAVTTIFFGIQLQKAQAPDYMVYILAGYVAWQVLIELILEVMQCCGRERARQELYEMDDMNNKKPEMKETAKTLTAKRVILMLHIFVLTVVTAIIIGFINIGEKDLE